MIDKSKIKKYAGIVALTSAIGLAITLSVIDILNDDNTYEEHHVTITESNEFDKTINNGR